MGKSQGVTNPLLQRQEMEAPNWKKNGQGHKSQQMA